MAGFGSGPERQVNIGQRTDPSTPATRLDRADVLAPTDV